MNKRIKNQLLKIAQETMEIETFESRQSDSLDFYDGLACWSIEKALEKAYELGQKEGEKKANK